MTAEINASIERIKVLASERTAEKQNPMMQAPPPTAEQTAEVKRLSRAREIALERKEVSAILNRWLNNAITADKKSAQSDCQKVIAFINRFCASGEAQHDYKE